MPTANGHTTAIRASQVIGTNVIDTSGQPIGKVEDVVLDKTRSRIMFAVVSIGGAVTTSSSFHAVPWSLLDYSEDQAGYVIRCTKDQLVTGPAVSMLSELTKDDGTKHRNEVDSHYNIDKDD